MATSVNNRYLLLDVLGMGGMGKIYRAFDRLDGQLVALKQMLLPVRESPILWSKKTDSSFRLHLAQEFKILASLRHPHIISVLDYGFDDNRQPYYTMELLNGGQSILDYSVYLSTGRKIELLMQVCQALVYLHRRGVIHRDLKPVNILVVNDTVKVLDFGLATMQDEKEIDPDSMIGTVSYMSPEALQGNPVDERMDLFALGIIAYELFTDNHPFKGAGVTQTVQNILYEPPDLLALDASLAAIIERLLAKDPHDRYDSAYAVLQQFAQLVNHPLQETRSIRDSFLQAAQFTGREREFQQLTTALKDLETGRGSIWLVGGESGSGKSRLLDELRPLALVKPYLVLRGQAIAEGAAPFQMWRDVLRRIVLEVEVTDFEASVLKSIVPDIGELLERMVILAPEIELTAAQLRLLQVVAALFERIQQPVVLFLEDLQWSPESLPLIQRLAYGIQQQSLLIVGTYRHEESPMWSQAVKGAQMLFLNRLDNASVDKLVTAMLGDDCKENPDILTLVEQESEGNIFFIIEVLRNLAESAGQLANINHMELPEHVYGAGIHAFVQRRLSHLSGEMLAPLKLAAILGRQLDLRLLRIAFPVLNLDAWLLSCGNVAVLDVYDKRWRFAHDKLREGLLASLSAAERRQLHRQAAECIEEVYGTDTTKVVSLAYHWRQAGDTGNELQYVSLAGDIMRAEGLANKAISYYERALELSAVVGVADKEQARLQQKLGEAYYGISNFSAAQNHSLRALQLLTRRTVKMPYSLLGEALRQLGHRLWGRPLRHVPTEQVDETIIITQVDHVLLYVSAFSANPMMSLYATLQMLNLAETLPGESPWLARSYANMMLVTSMTGLSAAARLYEGLLNRLALSADNPSATTTVLLARCVYYGSCTRWDELEAVYRQGIALTETTGDKLAWRDLVNTHAASMLIQGHFEASLQTGHDLYAYSVQTGDQSHLIAVSTIMQSLLHMGRLAEATSWVKRHPYEEMCKMFPNLAAVYTLHALYTGDIALAQTYATFVSDFLETDNSLLFGLMPSYDMECEYYLSRWEATGDAAAYEQGAVRAVRHLRAFSARFMVGRFALELHTSRLLWLQGKRAKAISRAQKALQVARRQDVPFYEARIHRILAGFFAATAIDDAAGLFHQQEAQRLFQQCGAYHYTGETGAVQPA